MHTEPCMYLGTTSYELGENCRVEEIKKSGRPLMQTIVITLHLTILKSKMLIFDRIITIEGKLKANN